MNSKRQRRRLLIALVLFALSVVALVLIQIPSSARRVPVYQGKTLYEWGDQLVIAKAVQPNEKQIEAAQAVHAIGTNALPFVMADLSAKYRFNDRVALWLMRRVPSLKLKVGNFDHNWRRGIATLEALGPIAEPLLPELVVFATNNVGYGPNALLAVGPPALPAFTNLLSTSKYPLTGNLVGAFANDVYSERIRPEEGAVALPFLIQVFRSQDGHGRWYAAGALGALHQAPDLTIPLLVEGLSDPVPAVRQASLDSLRSFGEAASAHAGKLAAAFDQADPNARRAICGALAGFRSQASIALPVLLRGLKDSDLNVRIWAATGIGQLSYRPEESVPALTNAMEDHSPIVRMMAAQAVGMFGRLATNALPALKQSCLDPDLQVRTTVTNALNRIRF